MMSAPDARPLDQLHIEGRKQWRVEPRYANTGVTQREEDALYFLECLPPEAEWAFWVVDRNLMRVGDKLVPRATHRPSLKFLHDWAEDDALVFATEAARRREEDRTKPYRDRAKTRLSLWVWADAVDDRGDLIEVFAPPGYSLWLWGRPRREVAAPNFHLKRSERAERLEKGLAGRTVEEYLAEAAKEADYSFEEFVAVRDRVDPDRLFTNAYLARVLDR